MYVEGMEKKYSGEIRQKDKHFARNYLESSRTRRCKFGEFTTNEFDRFDRAGGVSSSLKTDIRV